MGNAQIKLLLPTHDLPFTVPYQHPGELPAKIDKILTDLGPSTCLAPGQWALADIEGAGLLHSSCLARIHPGKTYLLVDVKDAGSAGEMARMWREGKGKTGGVGVGAGAATGGEEGGEVTAESVAVEGEGGTGEAPPGYDDGKAALWGRMKKSMGKN